jgi:hypothetical protein
MIDSPQYGSTYYGKAVRAAVPRGSAVGRTIDHYQLFLSSVIISSKFRGKSPGTVLTELSRLQV